MIKSKLHIFVLINSSLILLAIVFFAYKELSNNNKSIVYVDNVKLFDGFYMTKEMKKIGEKEFNARKLILDTLYLKVQSKSTSDSEKKLLMSQFIKSKEELERFNQNFGGEESAKIWSRIHDYTNAFSKEEHYGLIIGSGNVQTILGASEDADITNKLLYYINKKYEGSK